MESRKWTLFAALGLVAIALAAVGCGGGDDEASSEDLTPVTLQSKWVVQAQFAGYYAAVDQGFYEDEGLDVTIKPGGPQIVPEQVVLGGQAEFGIDWLDNLLATRDQGEDIVNIAQVLHPLGDDRGDVEGHGPRRHQEAPRARRSACGSTATSTSCSRR